MGKYNMSPKFDFYEVVKINLASNSDIDGKEGAILGMSQCDDGLWRYAVQIFENDDGWDLYEHQLLFTGKKMKRADFYSGEHVYTGTV